jgi:hypothetical protein
VRLRRAGETEWHEIPLSHLYTTNSRGLGTADMAYGLRSGLPYRANGELIYHVLDAMQAIMEASTEGRHIELTGTCERPEPLPPEKTLEMAWHR